MKKYTSAALLALKLTWKAAGLVMLLSAAWQTWLVRNTLTPGGIPLQVNFSFSSILDSTVRDPAMICGAVLLLVLILRTAATKGSKSIYTMKRLALTELQTAAVFGLVFAGYYLIYWAMELGLCFGYFAWYSRFSLVSSNALMMAAWDSSWFHFLLPLEEWFGYVRNLTICLSLGLSAALSSVRLRRGKSLLWSIVPCFAIVSLFPFGIANTTDFFLVPILAVIILGHYAIVLEGMRNEDGV